MKKGAGMKVDKDEFEAFIRFGIEGSVTRGSCVQTAIICYLFLPLLLTFPLILATQNVAVLLGLAFLPFLLYVVSVIRLMKNGRIEGEYYLLYNGINAIGLTWILGMGGMGMLALAFEGRERILAIVAVCVVYILVLVGYTVWIIHLIRKKVYSSKKYTQTYIGTTAFAVMGTFAAPFIVGVCNIHNIPPALIASVCFFFVSFLGMLGIFNVYKFWYIRKYMGH